MSISHQGAATWGDGSGRVYEHGPPRTTHRSPPHRSAQGAGVEGSRGRSVACLRVIDRRVAYDVGPCHGHRTGIGTAVAEIRDAFARHRSAGRRGASGAEVELVPYLLSARASVGPGERRLPLPAAFAHRMWSHAGWPRLDRWLGDVDVIHGTNYVVPPSRIPRLVSVYDCWFLTHPELAGPAVARAGAVLRRGVADGAHVHTSSAATAAAVRSLLNTDRVTTVHLGPPHVPQAPERAPVSGLPSGAFVATVGTRERRKNLPRLIEAFDMLTADGSGDDVALVVAGAAGDDDAATAAAVSRLGAAARRRTWLIGAVGPTTRSWLLHRASAIAYPSLDEGFGFPVLEAQTVGVPIVASRAGSIPEIGGDGVQYVDPLDPSDIARGLTRVLYDSRRRRELQSAAAANLARFSWDETVDGLARMYTSLAGGR